MHKLLEQTEGRRLGVVFIRMGARTQEDQVGESVETSNRILLRLCIRTPHPHSHPADLTLSARTHTLPTPNTTTTTATGADVADVVAVTVAATVAVAIGVTAGIEIEGGFTVVVTGGRGDGGPVSACHMQRQEDWT